MALVVHMLVPGVLRESVGPGQSRNTSLHKVLVRLNSASENQELQQGQELNQLGAETALGTLYYLIKARCLLQKSCLLFILPEGEGRAQFTEDRAGQAGHLPQTPGAQAAPDSF